MRLWFLSVLTGRDRSLAIRFPGREDGPGDPANLLARATTTHIPVRSGFELSDPVPEPIAISFSMQHDRPGSMNEEPAQVAVCLAY